MHTPLICARDGCGEQCGWIYDYPQTAHGQDPPESIPDDESLMDDEGNCYCSEDCMNRATGKEDDECDPSEPE